MKIKSLVAVCAVISIIFTTAVFSAPYAAIVIDTNTGEVLHEENAKTRLHPAGLTKLMTLYAAYDALETGLIAVDEQIRISKKAAEQEKVNLQLTAGQTIEFEDLLRAAAVKGANDAATAIGEGIDGSLSIFARRMNGMAKELGMERSTFRNPHGLTEKGHLSTARDIATLFIALKRDFPEQFPIFSREVTRVGDRSVVNSGRRLIKNIPGVRGAKFGYTRAAGFNGAVYVKRGSKEVVAVIFGGRSTATMIRQMQLIVDEGFATFN